jgi:hypothetical protein
VLTLLLSVDHGCEIVHRPCAFKLAKTMLARANNCAIAAAGRESLGVDDGRLGGPPDTDHGRHVVRLYPIRRSADRLNIVLASSHGTEALTELIADLGNKPRGQATS